MPQLNWSKDVIFQSRFQTTVHDRIKYIVRYTAGEWEYGRADSIEVLPTASTESDAKRLLEESLGLSPAQTQDNAK